MKSKETVLDLQSRNSEPRSNFLSIYFFPAIFILISCKSNHANILLIFFVFSLCFLALWITLFEFLSALFLHKKLLIIPSAIFIILPPVLVFVSPIKILSIIIALPSVKLRLASFAIFSVILVIIVVPVNFFMGLSFLPLNIILTVANLDGDRHFFPSVFVIVVIHQNILFFFKEVANCK